MNVNVGDTPKEIICISKRKKCYNYIYNYMKGFYHKNKASIFEVTAETLLFGTLGLAAYSIYNLNDTLDAKDLLIF